jgi:hypothetical protein
MKVYKERVIVTAGIVVLAIILLVLGVQAASPDPQTVTVDGVAEVIPGKADMARDAAVADALRRAVGQVVGTMMESSILVQNYQLVTDKIYTQTKGYVKSYQIIDERQDGTLYKVTVKAAVDGENISTDLQALGLLYQRMNKPRMMVIMSERHAGAAVNDPAGETEIIRMLLKNGFKVVDQAQVRKVREGDQLKQVLEGNTVAAQSLGRQHGAEVLIVGEAFYEKALEGRTMGGLVSVRARLQAKAIRADTGEIFASEGSVAPALDVSEQVAGRKALTAAAKNWMDMALPVILEQWTMEVNGGNSIQMIVEGLSLPQLRKFLDLLMTETRIVKELQQRSFAANIATFDVDLKGTSQNFSDELTQKKFPSFQLEVTGFTPNRIDIHVAPK